jgi:hypothetical protein
MSLFIRQEDERSELQKGIAAQLQRRARENSKDTDKNVPDGVEDSQYIKGTKKTTSLAWVWIIIIIVAVGIAVWLTVLSVTG